MICQGHMKVVIISNTLFMAMHLNTKFHKQKMTVWAQQWPRNSFIWPWYTRHMKVVMIHDTSSYDNTATYQISYTANVVYVQQLNNSKLKVSLSCITGIGGNVCIFPPHTSLTATAKIWVSFSYSLYSECIHLFVPTLNVLVCSCFPVLNIHN